MNICILSLYKSENLGEMAYTECVRRMIENQIHEVNIHYVDIHGRDAEVLFKEPLIVKFLRKVRFFSLEKKIRSKAEIKFLKNYYLSRIKDADAVIVPGGGYIKCTPKSKFDRFYRYNVYFDIMSQICESNGTGLYFNAVGHTINRNEENEIQVWKEVFSHPAIRYMSCRDELAFFQKVYNPSVQQVCCSAAYIADYYGMTKDSKSNTIGIGVIRPDAFADYGINISEESLIDFYVKTIRKLKDNYDVKIFTNGLKRDYQFGLKIAGALDDDKLMVERPERIEELLETIASFKAVIVSRMHAAIIAYSFDIPAVCLCWNNKHEAFLKGAGVPERAIYPDRFETNNVITVLEEAIENGWPKKQREVYRKTAIESVNNIISIIMDNEQCRK